MLTDEEKDKILELKGQGYSDFKIGKMLGVDAKTVRKYSKDDEENEINHPSSLKNSEPREPSIRPVKGKGGPMSTLKQDAYQSAQYDFKLEMLRDEQEEYRERKNRARKEEQEQEKREKLERFRIAEQQRQAEEREKKARVVIQQVKEKALPVAIRQTFPRHIMALIYLEIEKVLSKTDVIGFSENELVILAEGIRDRVIEQNIEEIREGLYEYSVNLCLTGVKEVWKNIYDKYRMDGGDLSYRDFIFACASRLPPEKREQVLSVIL
jgi:hypothetical protein